MEEALSIGLSGLAGLIAGGAWMWWRRPYISTNVLHEVERPPLLGHKCEWHVLGKQGKRVRMWCTVPGCKKQRNQDGPE